MQSAAPSESARKLISALRRVSVEAMITTRLRVLASSNGSAAMPSRSGISTSSTTTSGSALPTCSTASRPVRSEATTSRSGSASTQRASRPPTTTASSTIMTRIRRLMAATGGCGATATLIALYSCLRGALATARSDQPDFLKLGLDNLPVERLHDVLVGTRMQSARDVRDIVLGGAEHYLGTVPAGQPA